MRMMRTLFFHHSNNNSMMRNKKSNIRTTAIAAGGSPAMYNPTRTYLCLAAAAALSASSTQAWVATTTRPPRGLSTLSTLYPYIDSSRHYHHHPIQISPLSQLPLAAPAPALTRKVDNPRLTSTTTRLYFSSPYRNDNKNKTDNKDDGGIVGTIKSFLPTKWFGTTKEDDKNKNSSSDDGGIVGTIKSFLPTKWFGTAKEKEALQRKEEVKNQVSNELTQLLKGAPLGIRMIGEMVAPLVGSLASTLAEGVAEQQRTIDGLLDDARMYILNDPAISDALGPPIQLGQPFSQSSSMTSVNGMTQSRVELSMNIAGMKRTGVARLSATEAGISQLIVETGGKVFNVNTSSRRRPSTTTRWGTKGTNGGGGGGGGGDGNIIEAEIIDKKTKR